MASQSGIAVVTEALRRRLTDTIRTDFPGVHVVAKRPEVNDGQSQSQVSIYLYRVSEGPLRNLPQRDSGDGPVAALDLHYLLSFTGDEDGLVPQRMMALAVACLHTSPVLSSAEIEAARVEGWLADSGLKDEVELVRLTMSAISLEELSQVWSVFVQVPLQLSVGYKAGVVLIDPEPATGESPPLQARGDDDLPISSPGVEPRIDRETWLDDVQIPDDEKRMLVQIRDQMLLRATVYDHYGFRPRLAGNVGVTALFAGESGTGKTMAAEALARELHLDVLRVDLSTVVSKYIEETEKHVNRLLDTAEASSTVLLFDEADAIFGKRSDVKDSHDRFANIEARYLLQRIEAYAGLAILTTSRKSNLDPAFTRRLRFIITFPFPGVKQRRNIWRGIFPRARADLSSTGLNGVDALDFEALATPPLTGGQIRNIAVNGAFLAAAGDGVITMDLLQVAAKDELRKMGRSYLASDFSAWGRPGSDV